MTTLADYLRDAITEAIKKSEEGEILSTDEDAINELVDEYITEIIARLIER